MIIEIWGVSIYFSDHYQQKFLGKVTMVSVVELAAGTMVFEQRRNSSYRYSKLGGRTPIKALSASKAALNFQIQMTSFRSDWRSQKRSVATWFV